MRTQTIKMYDPFQGPLHFLKVSERKKIDRKFVPNQIICTAMVLPGIISWYVYFLAMVAGAPRDNNLQGTVWDYIIIGRILK